MPVISTVAKLFGFKAKKPHPNPLLVTQHLIVHLKGAPPHMIYVDALKLQTRLKE